MLNEEHARGPGIRRAALFFGPLAALALLSQIIATLLAPAGIYYPDSFCYVVLPHGAPCSGHPPGITLVWAIAGLGVLSEHRVLIGQAVLGIAAVVFLGWALRTVSSVGVAFTLAAAFAVLPLRLFFTRTLMTETVETFFVCLFLAAAAEVVRVARPRALLGWTLLASLALGGAASVHFAFLPVAIGLWLVLAVIVALRAPWSGLMSGRRLRGVAGVATASLLVVLGTVLPAALDEYRWYGTLSGNPVQGTTLAARWSPVLSCSVPPGSMPMTRVVIAAACQDRSWRSPTGITVDAMWNLPISNSLILGPDKRPATFAAVQGQLTGIVRRAMLAHPVEVAKQVLMSLVWQIGGTPYDDISGFHSASSNRSSGDWTLGVPSFPNEATWFGSATMTPISTQLRPMLELMSGTMRVAQVLLWLALGGCAVRLGGRLARRLRRWPVPIILGRRMIPGEARRWLTMDSAPLLGVLVGVATLLSGISVAIGSMPSFHYELPLTPFVLVILGLCLRRPGYADVPAPDMNCSGSTEMNSASDSAISVSPARTSAVMEILRPRHSVARARPISSTPSGVGLR